MQIVNGFDFFDAVKRLDQDYFDWPWSDNQWDQLLKVKDDYLLLVAMDAISSIKGMVLFQLDPECCHLLKILVSPSFRKQGLAQALVDASLQQLVTDAIYLEVAEENYEAQQFYIKNGFSSLVVKKNFYRDGSNALAMQLKIK